MEDNKMPNKLKIGYYCLHNPESKKVWSGTHYSLLKAIESANCEVVNLSPIIYPRSYHRLLTLYNKIHRFFSSKLINEEFTFLSAIYSALYFKKVIKNKQVDILFCPASSAQIVLLPTKIPIIFFNDTTFDQLKNYYTNFKYYSAYSLWISSQLQKYALRRAEKIILSSTWAINFALNHYQNVENKVVLSLLGANMEIPKSISDKKYESPFIFLFVGLNWERKGGEIVVETIEILRKQGFDCILNCVGVKPPVEKDYLTYYGYLDKNKPADAAKFKELYLESHFLFVPSRAECFGIVFSEASAYGLYSFSTKTGGITSAIKDQVNGSLFSLDASAEEYSSAIKKILLDPQLMKHFSILSRNYYEEYLHWRNFSIKFNKICHDIPLKNKLSFKS
jgi:starch synthase